MDSQAVAIRTPEGVLAVDHGFEADVVAGLSSRGKWLPSKYFYDAEGSALFERITGTREYYVARSEISILNSNRLEIGSLFPSNCALVEFGAGSSRKSRILLGATASIAAYVPIDISGEFLERDVAKLRHDFPHLAVHPVVCDFTRDCDVPEVVGSLPRVGFFPGSTIGNLHPYEAGRLLRKFKKALGKGAVLVIGADLIKDSRIFSAAYDDAGGATARFNLNLLKRINRELDADFNLKAFKHRAFFNEAKKRVEMHLVSMCPQEVQVGGRMFQFLAGETIHTENSYKYTMKSFQDLAVDSGWSVAAFWTDNLFGVHAFINR